MRRSFKAVSGVLVLAVTVTFGCEGTGESNVNSVLNRFDNPRFNNRVADAAEAAGADAKLSRAIREGTVAAAAIAIAVLEQRQASDEERQTARRRGAEQLETVDQAQRQEMKDQETYVAVPVADRPDQQQRDVMIIDPATSEPVDDTVYVVDAGDQHVEAGNKVNLGGYDAIYVD